ncbi:transporter substrate-binding domain-containing protein [Oscillospiraceae bacterium MB08-C2-2]|nr:transporter substrate-binding domain-containing protein [Oscillospiraceae bacterium MB08-C2-2]
MKKKLGLILFLVLSLVLTACGGAGNSSQSQEPVASASPSAPASEAEAASSEAPAASGGELIMATEAGFAPYEYYSGSDIVGVDVDIAKEIAAEMGKTLKVVDMEFGAIIPTVDAGKADFGAAGMSITEERKEQVDFTIEYATSKQVIVVAKDSAIKGPADLGGKTVGVQLGTTGDLVLADEYPDVTLKQYNKFFDATNDLINKRIDAIVVDSLPAQEIVKTSENLVILDEELLIDKYAFCVKKGNTELLDTINKVMQRLVDEGKIDEYTLSHSA